MLIQNLLVITGSLLSFSPIDASDAGFSINQPIDSLCERKEITVAKVPLHADKEAFVIRMNMDRKMGKDFKSIQLAESPTLEDYECYWCSSLKPLSMPDSTFEAKTPYEDFEIWCKWLKRERETFFRVERIKHDNQCYPDDAEVKVNHFPLQNEVAQSTVAWKSSGSVELYEIAAWSPTNCDGGRSGCELHLTIPSSRSWQTFSIVNNNPASGNNLCDVFKCTRKADNAQTLVVASDEGWSLTTALKFHVATTKTHDDMLLKLDWIQAGATQRHEYLVATPGAASTSVRAELQAGSNEWQPTISVSSTGPIATSAVRVVATTSSPAVEYLGYDGIAPGTVTSVSRDGRRVLIDSPNFQPSMISKPFQLAFHREVSDQQSGTESVTVALLLKTTQTPCPSGETCYRLHGQATFSLQPLHKSIKSCAFGLRDGEVWADGELVFNVESVVVPEDTESRWEFVASTSRGIVWDSSFDPSSQQCAYKAMMGLEHGSCPSSTAFPRHEGRLPGELPLTHAQLRDTAADLKAIDYRPSGSSAFSVQLHGGRRGTAYAHHTQCDLRARTPDFLKLTLTHRPKSSGEKRNVDDLRQFQINAAVPHQKGHSIGCRFVLPDGASFDDESDEETEKYVLFDAKTAAVTEALPMKIFTESTVVVSGALTLDVTCQLLDANTRPVKFTTLQYLLFLPVEEKDDNEAVYVQVSAMNPRVDGYENFVLDVTIGWPSDKKPMVSFRPEERAFCPGWVGPAAFDTSNAELKPVVSSSGRTTYKARVWCVWTREAFEEWRRGEAFWYPRLEVLLGDWTKNTPAAQRPIQLGGTSAHWSGVPFSVPVNAPPKSFFLDRIPTGAEGDNHIFFLVPPITCTGSCYLRVSAVQEPGSDDFEFLHQDDDSCWSKIDFAAEDADCDVVRSQEVELRWNWQQSKREKLMLLLDGKHTNYKLKLSWTVGEGRQEIFSELLQQVDDSSVREVTATVTEAAGDAAGWIYDLTVNINNPNTGMTKLTHILSGAHVNLQNFRLADPRSTQGNMKFSGNSQFLTIEDSAAAGSRQFTVTAVRTKPDSEILAIESYQPLRSDFRRQIGATPRTLPAKPADPAVSPELKCKVTLYTDVDANTDKAVFAVLYSDGAESNRDITLMSFDRYSWGTGGWKIANVPYTDISATTVDENGQPVLEKTAKHFVMNLLDSQALPAFAIAIKNNADSTVIGQECTTYTHFTYDPHPVRLSIDYPRHGEHKDDPTMFSMTFNYGDGTHQCVAFLKEGSWQYDDALLPTSTGRENEAVMELSPSVPQQRTMFHYSSEGPPIVHLFCATAQTPPHPRNIRRYDHQFWGNPRRLFMGLDKLTLLDMDVPSVDDDANVHWIPLNFYPPRFTGAGNLLIIPNEDTIDCPFLKGLPSDAVRESDGSITMRFEHGWIYKVSVGCVSDPITLTQLTGFKVFYKDTVKGIFEETSGPVHEWERKPIPPIFISEVSESEEKSKISLSVDPTGCAGDPCRLMVWISPKSRSVEAAKFVKPSDTTNYCEDPATAPENDNKCSLTQTPNSHGAQDDFITVDQFASSDARPTIPLTVDQPKLGRYTIHAQWSATPYQEELSVTPIQRDTAMDFFIEPRLRKKNAFELDPDWDIRLRIVLKNPTRRNFRGKIVLDSDGTFEIEIKGRRAYSEHRFLASVRSVNLRRKKTLRRTIRLTRVKAGRGLLRATLLNEAGEVVSHKQWRSGNVESVDSDACTVTMAYDHLFHMNATMTLAKTSSTSHNRARVIVSSNLLPSNVSPRFKLLKEGVKLPVTGDYRRPFVVQLHTITDGVVTHSICKIQNTFTAGATNHLTATRFNEGVSVSIDKMPTTTYCYVSLKDGLNWEGTLPVNKPTSGGEQHIVSEPAPRWRFVTIGTEQSAFIGVVSTQPASFKVRMVCADDTSFTNTITREVALHTTGQTAITARTMHGSHDIVTYPLYTRNADMTFFRVHVNLPTPAEWVGSLFFECRGVEVVLGAVQLPNDGAAYLPAPSSDGPWMEMPLSDLVGMSTLDFHVHILLKNPDVNDATISVVYSKLSKHRPNPPALTLTPTKAITKLVTSDSLVDNNIVAEMSFEYAMEGTSPYTISFDCDCYILSVRNKVTDSTVQGGESTTRINLRHSGARSSFTVVLAPYLYRSTLTASVRRDGQNKIHDAAAMMINYPLRLEDHLRPLPTDDN